MDYTVGKYILWILLCIPMLVLFWLLLRNVFSDIAGISKKKRDAAELKKKQKDERERFYTEYEKTHGGIR